MRYMANAVIFATVLVLGVAPKAKAGQDKECSNATLQGSFGYTSTGTLLPSYVPPPFAGPFGEAGRQTFDGKGETRATATLSANGNITNVTIEGTYTVNRDCTGSMTLNVSPLDATVHAFFVIDDDGTEIRAIGTDSGLIETRVYKKQFREGRQDSSKLRPGARQLLPSFEEPAPVQVSRIFEPVSAQTLPVSKEAC
jgi:hypothetical protein